MAMLDMRDGVCAVCEHDEVICAEALEFGARGATRPMGVAYGGKDGMLGFQPEMGEAKGALRTYTCRSCGYTQWFADRPDRIPIEANLKTAKVKA